MERVFTDSGWFRWEFRNIRYEGWYGGMAFIWTQIIVNKSCKFPSGEGPWNQECSLAQFSPFSEKEQPSCFLPYNSQKFKTKTDKLASKLLLNLNLKMSTYHKHLLIFVNLLLNHYQEKYLNVSIPKNLFINLDRCNIISRQRIPSNFMKQVLSISVWDPTLQWIYQNTVYQDTSCSK